MMSLAGRDMDGSEFSMSAWTYRCQSAGKAAPKDCSVTSSSNPLCWKWPWCRFRREARCFSVSEE